MLRRLAVPILLVLNGIINLFPRTFDLYLNWGIEPVTIRTIIGFISAVIAIYLLSEVKLVPKE